MQGASRGYRHATNNEQGMTTSTIGENDAKTGSNSPYYHLSNYIVGEG